MLIGSPNKECRDTAHRDILGKDSDDDKDILKFLIMVMIYLSFYDDAKDILEKVSDDERCFKGVSRVFQGCLKLVLRVFKVSFMGV